IVRNANKFDLLIMGHRGRGEQPLPTGILLGSVAERVVVSANVPVLVAVQPISDVSQILVAYDGSEAARGALLMAENLAKYLQIKLRAITVVGDEAEKSQAKFLAE